MLFRLSQQCLYQALSSTLALPRRGDGNRANFGEVSTVKMQGAAPDYFAVSFEHHEVAHVFANLGERPRQKRSVARIGRNQVVDLLCIRQDGLTGAHGFPRKWLRVSALLR